MCLLGNKEGIDYREQERTTWHIGDAEGNEHPVWNHDEDIRHNVFAYNEDAQVWGWFDIDDERHWPARMQEHPAKEARTDGGPTAPTLESLKLGHQDNFYCAAPGRGMLTWGTMRRRNRRYTHLDAVQAELKLERGSEELEPGFADITIRDFRVPADSPLLKKRCYPRGEVPGVKLGVISD